MTATLYSCFDFRFASEVALGELTPAAPDDTREVVTIARGAVPAALDGADDPSSYLQRVGDTALLAIPRVARFLVSGGHTITVMPDEAAGDRAVRLFLLGSALGVLAYQRGLLPLHANALVFDGGVHAFAGPSGAGKSTLAAHFAHAGHEVLCDDVCALSFDEDSRPLAWPGLPRLKLWEDAARAFGHDPAALDRVADGHEKFHVAMPRAAAARPLPFRRLYALGRADAGRPAGVARLRGSEAMRVVMENCYRPEYVAPLGLTASHFAACSHVVRAAGIYALDREWGYDVFDREVALLEAHLRDGGGE